MKLLLTNLIVNSMNMICIMMFITTSTIIAELPRPKRANEAPWVRKIGKPSSRENFIMMSVYERASI